MKAVDYDAIANILTLRYNPANPQSRSLNVEDFEADFVNSESAEAELLKIVKQDLDGLRVKNVALLLSGGIDSIFTLTMLREFRPDVRVSCLSMGFADVDDEIDSAQLIASKFDCNFEAVTKSDVLSELPSLIWEVKEPRWNLYQYYALREARMKSKTIFSGDGGDELFGGYTFRYQKFLSALPENLAWKEKTRLYLSCHERDWVPDQEDVFGSRIRFSWQRTYSLLRSHFDNNLAPIDQVFLADYNGKLLYDWIPANTAFAKTLDARVTSLFLTTHMTKFATRVSWQLKYDPKSNTGKLLLRSILKKRGVVAEPVKKGFSIDTVRLWGKNAQEIAASYVNSDSLVVRAGIISSAWIEKTYARLKTGLEVRYVNKMLGILALEVWWRLFVSGTMQRNERL